MAEGKEKEKKVKREKVERDRAPLVVPLFGRVTNRDRVVVENTRSRVKIKSKLTN